MKLLMSSSSPLRALFWTMKKGETTLQDEERDKRLANRKPSFLSKYSGLVQDNRLFSQLGKMGQGLIFLALYAFIFIRAGASVPSQYNPAYLYQQSYTAILMMLVIGMIFSFTTGIHWFYYSSDILFYLRLPIKSQTLLRVRILHFLISNLWSMGLIPLVYMFSIGYYMHVPLYEFPRILLYFTLNYLYLNFLFVLLLMLVVASSKWVRDKDRFMNVANYLIFTFILLFSMVIGFMNGSASTHGHSYASNFISHINLYHVYYSFISLPSLFAASFWLPSWTSFLWAFVLSTLAVLSVGLIVDILGGRFYFQQVGLVQSYAGSRKKLSSSTLRKRLRSSSVISSFRKVDARLLRRGPLNLHLVFTPLMIQFIFLASTLLAVIYVMVKVSHVSLFEYVKKAGMFLQLLHTWSLQYLHVRSYGVLFILFAFTIAFAYFDLIGNVASLEFMRDAKSFYFYRTLPLTMKQYLHAKLRRSFVFFVLPKLVFLVLPLLLVRPSFSVSLLLLLWGTSMLCSTTLANLLVAGFKLNFSQEEDLAVQVVKGFGQLFIRLFLLVIHLPLLPWVFKLYHQLKYFWSVSEETFTAVILNSDAGYYALAITAYYVVLAILLYILLFRLVPKRLAAYEHRH